ncbi:hypothetical protein HYW18_00045 [Candidatus Uhrbacteria bacterium]|nr:hypothetical protein [Candidatus Uhrbacteria bacterium]
MILNDYTLGAALGLLVGFVLAVPAIVVEWREKKEQHPLPILVDIKPKWGRSLTYRELFLVALLLHFVLATLFGLIYVIFVEQGWLFVTHAPYTLLSLVIYAVGAWLVVGILIFPAVGFGLFGRREGPAVWAEIFVTQLLIGLGMWGIIQWLTPAYFS